MIRCLIAWILICSLTVPLFASSHYNGYIADGYTYRNGYWYYGNQAYSRTQYWQPGYYRGCCYIQGYYYYKYYPVQAQTYSQPTTNYNDPDWRSKLLDIAAQRDKTEGEIRKGAFEQAYFMQAVQGLGLQGNFNWQGYGLVPPYVGNATYGMSHGPYSLYGQINYGANATTQYGVSQTTLAQIYGENNAALLYQMASQHVQGAQRLAGEGASSFQGLIQTEGTNRARVAEIMARGQAITMIAQALIAPSSDTSIKSYQFKITPAGELEKNDSQVPAATKAAMLEAWKVLVQDRCLPCHSNDKSKGGFNVLLYPEMNTKQKDRVILTLTTQTDMDSLKAMPRDKDDPAKIGKRLTPEELRLFLLN